MPYSALLVSQSSNEECPGNQTDHRNPLKNFYAAPRCLRLGSQTTGAVKLCETSYIAELCLPCLVSSLRFAERRDPYMALDAFEGFAEVRELNKSSTLDAGVSGSLLVLVRSVN